MVSKITFILEFQNYNNLLFGSAILSFHKWFPVLEVPLTGRKGIPFPWLYFSWDGTLVYASRPK